MSRMLKIEGDRSKTVSAYRAGPPPGTSVTGALIVVHEIWGPLTRSMAAAAVGSRPTVSPDCGHAFFNDTNRFGYRAAAEASAWRPTVHFLADSMRLRPVDRG